MHFQKPLGTCKVLRKRFKALEHSAREVAEKTSFWTLRSSTHTHDYQGHHLATVSMVWYKDKALRMDSYAFLVDALQGFDLDLGCNSVRRAESSTNH